MPTPRPIIVASVAPVDGMFTMCPLRPTMPRATLRATTAVMIGIPIATRLPSTRLRITIAAAMPTTSLLSVGSLDSVLPSDPPASTSMPASRAGSAEEKISFGQLLVDLAGVHVEQHRDEAGAPVLRQQPRGLAAAAQGLVTL